MRPTDACQYNPLYFFRDQAIVVPVLIEDDIEGDACETQANILPQMVNVRKNEGNCTTSGFARKEFVSCSLSLLLTCCFCRGDEPWSTARPGIVYIVPTRYPTVDAFKKTHLSRYKRNKMKLPYIKKPRKPRNDRGKPHVMSSKPRKPRNDRGKPHVISSKPRKPRSGRGIYRKQTKY